MFQMLFTYPFFSSAPRSGYMVLGPKYTPKPLRILVMSWYPCIDSFSRYCRIIMSRRPFVSFVWICFWLLLLIIFLFFSCWCVVQVYNVSFLDTFSHVLIVHKPPIKPSHITKAYQENHLSNTTTYRYIKYLYKKGISKIYQA